MSRNSDEPYNQLAVVGKAFANAKRLELMSLLLQGEKTVETLAREANLGMSTTSAHLQVLKLTSLVSTRQEGTHVYYSTAGPDVDELYGLLLNVARKYSPAVDQAVNAMRGPTGVEEMAPEELLHRMKCGNVAVVDVRPREDYDNGHIPGARSVPLAQIPEGIPDYNDDEELVVYCRGAYCVMATDAVQLLAAQGIHAKRLRDGMIEWRLAGHPVETGGNQSDRLA